MKYVEYNYRDVLGNEYPRHSINLSREESKSVLLTYYAIRRGWQRNGGVWQHASGGPVPAQDVDVWLRENVGYRHGEVWSCDRFYFVDEELPELPKMGGRGQWLERFTCYPDHGTDPREDWGWDLYQSSLKGFDVAFVFHTLHDATTFRLACL